VIREESGESKALNYRLKDSIAASSLQYEELLAAKKKLSGQIVNSPERFRKQIIDVGQSLQAEQKDAKAAERKVRELSAWLNNVEECQIEVTGALEAVHEVKGEMETVHQLNRQGSRAEEKLTHLRKQTSSRGEETQQAVDELHKQLVDAETARTQVKARVERAEGEALRIEREAEADEVAQEQERADMVSTYQRLERGVVSHLQDVRRALEERPPPNVV
jgi:kinetochore protein Nuf2